MDLICFLHLEEPKDAFVNVTDTGVTFIPTPFPQSGSTCKRKEVCLGSLQSEGFCCSKAMQKGLKKGIGPVADWRQDDEPT